MTAPASAPRWLIIVTAVLLASLALRSAGGMYVRCQRVAPNDAADAVPLYLSGLALREGGDPTDVVYRERLAVREQTHTQVLSTLYPATIAAPMATIVGSGWAPFLARWRAIVLGVFVVGAAAAGWGGSRGPWAPVGAGLGAALASAAFPLTESALLLGQANLLIAGLLGLATWSAARNRGGEVAVAAVVGAAVKLVPAIALWPLFAARRWRALGVAAIVGGLILVVTVSRIPIANVVGNVIDTVRFQQDVRPAWQGLSPGPLLPFLAVVRLSALGALSLVVAGVCVHATRGSAERSDVSSGAIALLVAWLGASASAVGVYYGLLALPALIRLTVRPLAAGTSRWSALLVPMAALPTLVVTAELMDVRASLQMFLVTLAVWAATAIQVVASSWPRLGRAERVLILVATLIAFGGAATFIATGPGAPPPGGGHLPPPMQAPAR